MKSTKEVKILKFNGVEVIQNKVIDSIIGSDSITKNALKYHVSEFIKGTDYFSTTMRELKSQNNITLLGNPNFKINVFTLEGINKLDSVLGYKYSEELKYIKSKYFMNKSIAVTDNLITMINELSVKTRKFAELYSDVLTAQNNILLEVIKLTNQSALTEEFPDIVKKEKSTTAKPVLDIEKSTEVKPVAKKEKKKRRPYRNWKHDNYPDNWEEYYTKYENGEITKYKASKELDIANATFCKLYDRYSNQLSDKAINVETEYILPSNETQYEDNLYESFSSYRTKINMLCKKIYTSPQARYHTKNSVLNAAYSALLKEYGICWEQYKKEFKRENERKPVSTLELVYWIESNNTTMKNLLFEKIHTIQMKQEKETLVDVL